MSPNWNDYRFFLAVARCGRLSVAGRHLHVDHATVGRRIKSLEYSLKTILFDRAPTGYSLTPAGEELVSFAERIEGEVLFAEAAIGSQINSLSGKVRIGVPDGLTTVVVVKAAQKLCETYPRIELQLVALPQKFSLSKREVDFVIGLSPPEKGRLRVQKICNFKFHLYSSRDYLAKHSQVKSLVDLKKLRGIGYISDLIFDKALDYIPQVDSSYRPYLTSTSIHVQLSAVQNGAGVGILPDFMTCNDSNLVKVLPEDIDITRTFWYIVQDDLAQLERVKVCAVAIIKHMRQTFRELDQLS